VLVVSFSQESRTEGGAERTEYRPIVKMTTAEKQYVRITLGEDADLTNYFSIRNIQGGNRVGTKRNDAIAKFSSAYFRYAMMPALETYDGNQFAPEWHGWGVESNLWDIGQAGNYHMFTTTDAAKIPKGEYILQVKAEWGAETEANPVLKDMNLLVASPTSVMVDLVSDADAIKVLSMGKATLNAVGACPAYSSRKFDSGKTLAEYSDLAKAAGASQFMYAMDNAAWGAYWCDKGAYTLDASNFSGLMSIYDVLDPV